MSSTLSKAQVDRLADAPAAHTDRPKAECEVGSLEAMSLWHDPAIPQQHTNEMDFGHPKPDDFSEGDPEGLGYCRLM